MDEEGSKVRLVRCPKCENLLPELHDFSLYKCGGCGAVLQANKQGSRSDDSLKKSDDEKGEGVSMKEKLICEKSVSSIDSSPSKAQDKVFVKTINQTSRAETMDLQQNQGTRKKETKYSDDRYNPYSRGLFDKNQVHKNGQMSYANGGLSTFSDPHEGSSNYRSDFPHDFGVNKRVENLEHDRAELLRKIDELKIQLDSSSLLDRTRDSHLNKQNYYVPEGPCRANFQPFATDQNVVDPFYRDYKHENALNMGNIYPPNRAVRSSYQQPYHDHFSGPNMCLKQKYFAPQNCVSSLNGPQCYKNWQVQPTFQQNSLRSTHRHRSSGSYGLNTHNLVTRSVISHSNKRVCYPKTGGAPFLACPSCFVLLNLPESLTKAPKNGKKIRCGACSVLISVDFEKNGVVIRISTKLKQGSTEGDVGYGEALIEDVKILDDDLKVYESDNSVINSESTNIETNALSRDHSVKSGRSSERKGPVSSYSSFSEDGPSPDSVINVRENSKSADLALKDDPPLHEDSESADMALEVETDDEYADFVSSRCGMGSKSKRASRQNSVKDVPMVTENEVVYNDVAVSEEVNNEENQPRMEERESFLGGLFKKSFKDLLKPSRNVEMSRINVFVNGQPLLNRVVKKAEKLAGPIQPGNYWYDYRAGFWGVMGLPCHGIIPPYIEEFNYAMPSKCGAGNTGVFVNGRELHESDLDLLACRGLPTTKDKFYMIEISGRVVNEYTGEELDDLGRLAPTVEKVKHGFGMRPRAIAE